MQFNFRLSLTRFIVSVSTTSLVIMNPIFPYAGNSEKAYGDSLGNISCVEGGLFSNTTGSFNTACGDYALYDNTTGSYNTGIGDYALHGNRTGSNNTAIGVNALYSSAVGLDSYTINNNTAVGANALYSDIMGSYNTAIGTDALNQNTTGVNNIAIGYGALYSNISGGDNIAIGYYAGTSITTGNHNIYLGNDGSGGDTGVIRIGSNSQNKTFIAGISGVNISGGAAVYINSSGQLGTLLSSRRFKTDIHNLESFSQKILALRPVTFRYKQADETGSHPLQYGLIAEEVAQVFPELVQYDQQGKPFSVYYHQLTPLLLAELQQEHQKIAAQQNEITSLKQQVVAQQQQQATQMALMQLKLKQLYHLIQASNTNIRLSKK
jgi:hypothetical protein